MIYNKTAPEKILDVLKTFQKEYRKGSSKSLVAAFKANHLASEYSQFVIELNVLKKIKGGSRGPCFYMWNKDVTPTIELATELCHKFNTMRRPEAKYRNIDKKSSNSRLDEIESLLKQILQKLS